MDPERLKRFAVSIGQVLSFGAKIAAKALYLGFQLATSAAVTAYESIVSLTKVVLDRDSLKRRIPSRTLAEIEREQLIADAQSAQTIERPAGPMLEDLPENIRIYAIGDVHGRADLLEDLIEKIDQDVFGYEGTVYLVFLGDYIDRGLQSCQVLDLLLNERLSRYETVFLKGNHEEAMVSFINDYSFGPSWAAYGGRETLVSYGVRPPKSLTLTDDWKRAHDEFVTRLPHHHEIFLMSLKTHFRIGPYGFVHAGVRSGTPFEHQSDKDRLWIREEFLNAKDREDVIIVHGHTPVNSPFQDHRRINVDTGAYFTGRLTAVKLEREVAEFLTTTT